MSSPSPGDDARRVARDALKATDTLEQAILAGDLARARQALEQGALPEMALFRRKKGDPTGSAVSKALGHPQFSMPMLELLVDAGAPLPVAGVGCALQAALRHDRLDAIAYLANRQKPRAADWMVALTRPVRTFRALDDVVHMDRTKALGTKHRTGYPPLFLVHDPALLDYLLDTGADAHQVPGGLDAPHLDGWHARSALNHFIRTWAERARAGYVDHTLPLVQALQACGVELTEADFKAAYAMHDEPLVCYFIDQGFRLQWADLADPVAPYNVRLMGHQALAEAEVLDHSTQSAQGSRGARRL